MHARQAIAPAWVQHTAAASDFNGLFLSRSASIAVDILSSLLHTTPASQLSSDCESQQAVTLSTKPAW